MPELLIIFGSFVFVVIVILLFVILPLSFVVTKQATNKIIERFGKFVRVAHPGLSMKIPFIDSVAATIDLRLQQLNVLVESKTKDNVFVNIPVAVQFRPLPDRVREAYYSLSAPEEQIRAYVFDTIRTTLADLSLDEAYSNKDAIANDIEAAEAEAETKRLQGVGVASQRKAIVEGLAEQYQVLRAIGIDESPEQLLMMTQYFDTLRDIGTQSRSNTIFVPSNAGGLASSQDEIRNTLLAIHAQEGAPLAPQQPQRQHPQQQPQQR